MGLAVDGYVISFGADTSQFEAGSKRVRDRARVDADYFANQWDRARLKTVNQFFGFTKVGVAAVAGVAAAAGIATKGFAEYARQSAAGKAALSELSTASKRAWGSIGQDVLPAVGYVTGFVDAIRRARDGVRDFFQGRGATAGLRAAEAARAEQDRTIADRGRLTADLRESQDAELEYMIDNHNDTAAAEERFRRRMKAVRDKYAPELNGPAGRSRDLAGEIVASEKFQAERDLLGVYDRRGRVERDSAEAAWERVEREGAIKDRLAEQTQEQWKQQREDRRFVALAAERARADGLAADHREREAEALRISLDYEERIQDVMARQDVDLFERLDAVDAIGDARDRAIRAATRRGVDEIGGSVAPGFGGSAAFRAQVLGGAQSTLERNANLQAKGVEILQQIERNTAAARAAVFAP